jgi:hydroxymethylpyrimidine/phosphomethylpyrimidine kinase
MFRVLSIAGSDSGGGAGIQADLKTITAYGGHGMTAVTAITAQNTLGVSGIQAIDPSLIVQQIEAVFDDIGVDVVKIGMLASPEIVQSVANVLKRYQAKHIVLDPVLIATSGASLGGSDTGLAMIKAFAGLATIITPNLFETGVLLNRTVGHTDEMLTAAQDLANKMSCAVLVKGGHLPGDQIVDVLIYKKDGQWQKHQYQHEKIKTNNTHGTGCTLSTAIACELAQGREISLAVGGAIDYLQGALKAAKNLSLGQGPGPLWHMHKYQQP